MKRPAMVLAAGACLAAGLALFVAPPVRATEAPERTSEEIEAEQAKLAAVGRAIVTEHCARCHATGLKDTSTHPKAPPFREVVDRYPSEDLAEALAEGIVSGHPDMPVFQFDPPQIEGFIAYLDELFLAGLEPPPPATGPDK